jgi:[ribosomal protein S5]-alanine N-acetyltransferase
VVGSGVLGSGVAPGGGGRGVATATVRELCQLAAARYGLRTLKAAVTHKNVASQKVLTKAGFLPVGPADIGGKPATWYQRDLAVDFSAHGRDGRPEVSPSGQAAPPRRRQVS